MNKKVILPTLGILTLLGVAAFSVNAVKADFEGNGFAARVAERFGLNEDEVDSFFNEMHEERMTQMHESKEERLNEAVSDGVISQEQKNALLSKHQEMWQQREANRESHHEEMEAWFDEQGIDHDSLREYMGGFGPRGGMHKMGGFGKLTN